MTKYQRSVLYLQTIEKTRIPLKNIINIQFLYNNNGPYNTAIRKFIYNRLPFIRYHNPSITLEATINRDKSSYIDIPKLVLTTQDGNIHDILANQYSTCGDILKQVLRIDGSEHLIPQTLQQTNTVQDNQSSQQEQQQSSNNESSTEFFSRFQDTAQALNQQQ